MTSLYKILKANMENPYHLFLVDLKTEEIRFLTNNEVAQVHASYPDMLKDNFLKAIILTDFAMKEIGINFYDY